MSGFVIVAIGLAAGLIIGLIILAIITLIFRWLWNTTMPAISNLKEITTVQAIKLIFIAAILFGIGWAGASFLEGISQSGAMGLIFFCAPGIILITLTWRYLIAPDLDKTAE